MCAYKLCKVEFRYWGMQTKIEKFIHEVGMFIISYIYIILYYYLNKYINYMLLTKLLFLNST